MVKTVYNWGQRRELLGMNRLALYRFKVAKDRRPEPPAEYAREERDAILQALRPDRHTEWRAWTAVAIAAYQGARMRAIDGLLALVLAATLAVSSALADDKRPDSKGQPAAPAVNLLQFVWLLVEEWALRVAPPRAFRLRYYGQQGRAAWLAGDPTMMHKVFFVQECPTCGRSLEIGVAHLGREVYCRHCHAKFLARLLQGAQRKVFLILDRHPAHEAAAVADWVSQQQGQIELFFLPQRAPELNPDAYRNNDLKGPVNAEHLPDTNKELESNVQRFMNKLLDLSERVMSYFQHPKVQYAAATPM